MSMQSETQPKTSDEGNGVNPVLGLQLEFLKLEAETIDSSIRQMDEFSKNIKQWAITVWAGAVGGALATDSLAPYIGLTATIPLLFWFIDGSYRRIQQMFIWRTARIRDFLNNHELLQQSFLQGKIVGLTVFDPSGKTDWEDKKYLKFVDWRRPMLFKSISFLYLGLITISFCLALAWNLLRR
jgi:hypothetical protein